MINSADKPVLTLLPDRIAVCRLSAGTPLPQIPSAAEKLYSVTVTDEEISIICREELAPEKSRAERGFIAFKVEGPLDFSLTGLLASLLNPLAAAGVAVFTLSTYDTDYLLVKADLLKEASRALEKVATINC